VQSGISALTGAPVFNFKVSKIGDEPDGENTLYTLDEVFGKLMEANTKRYPMGLGTSGKGDDQEKNRCGVAMSHAYSIIDAFVMTDFNNTEHRMLMIRNPWGRATYTGKWHEEDPDWTLELIAQIPQQIDPRTSYNKGIFFAPVELLYPQDLKTDDCFADF
jgi:hypothetical protein